MAEVVASVLSIIVFALKSSQLLCHFFRNVRNAPNEISSIQNDAEDLTGTLNAIYSLVADGIVLGSAANLLSRPLNTCKIHLQALYCLLQGFTRRGRWDSAFMWRWKRSEITSLRESISFSQQTLATSLIIAQSQAAFAGNQKLSSKLEVVLQSKIDHSNVWWRETAAKGELMSNASQSTPPSGLYEVAGSEHPWAGVPVERVFAMERLQMANPSLIPGLYELPAGNYSNEPLPAPPHQLATS